MDVNLEHLDYQQFEDLCNDLLRQEIGRVTSIDGSGGDQGVDGFKGELENDVIIYQQKFYTGRLDYNRKQNILDSLETAKENHSDLRKWVLLIASEFTHSEQEWFENNIVQIEDDIEIECWNKKEIEDKTCKHEHLVHRYFPTSMLSAGQRQRELLNYLSGSVVEKGSIIKERLDEIQDEHPHLDIEYEFSSIDDTQRLHIEPESEVSIHTDLNIGEEKANKIKNREKVKFTQEEIGNIEFNPELIPDEELEPSELVVKPWYEDWERDVQIEIPGGRFKKEFTIGIEDITDDTIIIEALDPVFGLVIRHNIENQETDIDIKPKFDDMPIHKISECLNFIDDFKSYNRIIMRELETGEPVFSGELISTQGVEENEWFRDIITRLEIIESHAGVSLSLSEKIGEEEEIDIIVASDLITNKESTCPFSITGDIIDGKEKELLRIHNEKEDFETKVQFEEFYVSILGEEIFLGDIEFVYPNPELVNEDEIREKMGQSEPIEMELQPSEEAIIKLVE